MVRLIEGGEGVAILDHPKQFLFEFPSPQRFVQARTPRVAKGSKPAPTLPPVPAGYWQGAFVLTADLTWLREDEAVAISALVRMREGGEYLSLFTVEIDPTQGRQLWQSRPLFSMFGCAFQATQTKGAGDVRLPFWVLMTDGLTTEAPASL